MAQSPPTEIYEMSNLFPTALQHYTWTEEWPEKIWSWCEEYEDIHTDSLRQRLKPEGQLQAEKNPIICIPHLKSAVIIKIAFQLTYFVPVREEEKLILNSKWNLFFLMLSNWTIKNMPVIC